MRTKYEKSIPSKQTPKKTGSGGSTTKDKRKVTGLKDPADINIDVARAHEMDVEVGLSNEQAVSLKRKADHAPSTQLMPQRKHQTLDTLGVRANDRRVQLDEETETGGGGVMDHGVDLYKELMKTNEQLYKQRNNNSEESGVIFALSDLISLGLLSSQAPTVESRQAALANQYRDSVDFMRAQLKQIVRIEPTVSGANSVNGGFKVPGKNVIVLTRELSKKKNKNNTTTNDIDESGGTNNALQPMSSTVKLSNVFGPLNFTSTYLRRPSNDYKKYICPIYDKQKERLTRVFFIDDNLEENVPPGSLPSSFKIFQQLKAAHWAKYEAHEQSLRDLSQKAPRVVMEVVPRAHIKQYRYRPVMGVDELCANRTKCYFYTISSDPDVRYIGKVFRTPRQLELIEKEGSIDKAIPRECSDLWLCIDCLLAGWTKRHADNFIKERSPKQVTNHFTVAVGKGEYSEGVMLHKVFNKLVTGFVGHVPHYHESHRASAEVTLRHLGQQQEVTESYIAEIGMDF